MDRAMKKLLIILFGIFMIGCATTANYEKILSSWVGANEIDLVRAWGRLIISMNPLALSF
jgi:hypothetical protein